MALHIFVLIHHASDNPSTYTVNTESPEIMTHRIKEHRTQDCHQDTYKPYSKKVGTLWKMLITATDSDQEMHIGCFEAENAMQVK